MTAVISGPTFYSKPHRFWQPILSKSFLKYSNVYLAAVLSSILLAMTATTAQANDALKMSLSASKVVTNSQGERIYIPVNTAKIGTLIQYKATYSNTLNTSIQNATLTLPIPTNTEFTGEAYPPSAQASLDYYNYHDLPLMRMVDGKLVEVPYSEYKSLRWDIKYIPPRKSVSVAFNTIVH
ncbi:hypothetical protein [Psychrobacter phenylpyruvicus]|uniref:Uncharacterized protein conserved in bacteria n=1 Tax=Psychrobacter phenylpyruvicus TaxID=29432 RepID=A0A379LM42_9GAMM|nr:hypothetical protein [Psychrobacter phenylpyruvicus]SUD90947.1 Uncharacterized protein conserved in bacteria [Psychrobacter phenylpyruvicus]